MDKRSPSRRTESFSRRATSAVSMKIAGSPGPKDIDAYLAAVPADKRAVLEDLRKTIRAAAPDAEEIISYGMPAFRQNGTLVYFAAFEDHFSFFPGSVVTQRRFAAELKPFAAGKGTIHFTSEHPLPATLVRRIVQARLAENKARAEAKARKAPGKPRKRR